MNNKGVKWIEVRANAIVKMASKKWFHYCFDSQVRLEEEKQTLSDRADAVRKLLTPEGCPPINNLNLFTVMLDAVEAQQTSYW